MAGLERGDLCSPSFFCLFLFSYYTSASTSPLLNSLLFYISCIPREVFILLDIHDNDTLICSTLHRPTKKMGIMYTTSVHSFLELAIIALLIHHGTSLAGLWRLRLFSCLVHCNAMQLFYFPCVCKNGWLRSGWEFFWFSLVSVGWSVGYLLADI